jgi:hypothetical protein
MAEVADRTLPGVPVLVAPMIADASHGMGVETIEHDWATLWTVAGIAVYSGYHAWIGIKLRHARAAVPTLHHEMFHVAWNCALTGVKERLLLSEARDDVYGIGDQDEIMADTYDSFATKIDLVGRRNYIIGSADHIRIRMYDDTIGRRWAAERDAAARDVNGRPG